MAPPIYLDWNATAPLLPEAWEAMRPAMEAVGNPASAHGAGRQARRLLEDAREQVAGLLGASPDEVVFTSGATEANNLAVFGHLSPLPAGERGRGEGRASSLETRDRDTGIADPSPPTPLPSGERGKSTEGHLLAATIEHPCVVEPLRQLAGRGFDVEWLPVNVRGQVETAAVMDRLRPDTRLVCLMLANHETGAIQPVRHAAKKLPKHIPLHCDAAQAVGKIPVNFRDLSVTTLTASAHKFRGPKGVGLLLVKREAKLKPLLFGGHQQWGQRPGTEPVALAVGLAAALAHAVREMDANRAKVAALRERLLFKLRERLSSSLSPLGRGAGGEGSTCSMHPVPFSFGDASPLTPNPSPQRGEGNQSVLLNGDPDGLPSTLNLSFPGCRADVLVMSLDLAGVACSTGSACSSGSLLPSPVLQAMGVADGVLRSAVRFSLGPTLTEAEIDDAAERIAGCVNAARAQAG